MPKKKQKTKHDYIIISIVTFIVLLVIILILQDASTQNLSGEARKIPGKIKLCKSDRNCASNQFCEFTDCSAQVGKCAFVPQNCLAFWNPVCGCNGRTYSNDCYRRIARVTRDYFGECKNKQEAYFKVIDGWGDTFIIKLIDPTRIQEARDILAGKITDRTHVMGTVVKEPTDYNIGWSYHLAPFSIQFFESAIEVCDGAFRDVEYHLDEVCGATFPDCLFCPWSSRLTREVNTQ